MKLQNALLRVYAAAKQRGMLSNPVAERAFLTSYFLYKRYLEDPFHGLLRDCPELLRGGHVIDVGANVGYNAALFAAAIDPGCKVFAFEPDPDNFRLLQRTARKRPNLEPVAMAVGASVGEVELWRNPRHSGDHRVRTESWRGEGDSVRVPVVSLDDFVRQRQLGSIAFVKIDVQGYELAVCRGLRDVLERNPRIAVALEYAPEAMRELGFDAAALLAFWTTRGFQPTVIGRSGKLRDVVAGELDAMAGADDYVNLLFRRA